MTQRIFGAFGLAMLGLAGVYPVQAVPPNYACYMQLRSQPVADLTKLCSHPETAQNTARFNDYLSSIKAFAKGDQRLLTLINQRPDRLAGAAQEYCADRAAGISKQQFLQAKYTALLKAPLEQRESLQTGMLASSLAAELAAPVYCPGL
jgi:hypothetical protein